ncbi:MAG: hypothetical protein KIH63_005920 [Candidatus Saccharibacteria bacterium]|nr:hypothetical protein [Candidatus Saccharibacteria bacterium]
MVDNLGRRRHTAADLAPELAGLSTDELQAKLQLVQADMDAMWRGRVIDGEDPAVVAYERDITMHAHAVGREEPYLGVDVTTLSDVPKQAVMLSLIFEDPDRYLPPMWFDRPDHPVQGARF